MVLLGKLPCTRIALAWNPRVRTRPVLRGSQLPTYISSELDLNEKLTNKTQKEYFY